MRISVSVMLSILVLCTSVGASAQNGITEPIDYLHDRPASCSSKLVQGLFSVAGVKKLLDRYMTGKRFSQEAARLPSSLRKNADVSVIEKDGRRVWKFTPKNAPSDKVILYVHGGAYILNISSYQWKFVDELVANTHATVIVPDYPLAPSAQCTDVYAFIGDIYRELLQSGVQPQNISILGDSAGGGFTLGFAQLLRQENMPQPADLILLSPWLDVSMNNPDLKEVDRKDRMLGIHGLQLAGAAYAGELGMNDFRVSPLNGDFQGLGNISVFIGTHDLLVMDCRKLKRMLNDANIPFNYFEYPKMFHGWMVVTGLKESKQALKQITALVVN